MKSKHPTLSTLLMEMERLQDEEIEMILKLNGGDKPTEKEPANV